MCLFGNAASAEDAVPSVCKVRAAAYDAAMETGNPANMGALYRLDAVENGPYGIFQGPKAISASYAGFVKPGVKHGHVIKGSRELGSAVMCWGEWTFSFAPGGPAKGLAGRYTAIYAKSGADWRIEALTFNFLPPP